MKLAGKIAISILPAILLSLRAECRLQLPASLETGRSKVCLADLGAPSGCPEDIRTHAACFVPPAGEIIPLDVEIRYLNAGLKPPVISGKTQIRMLTKNFPESQLAEFMTRHPEFKALSGESLPQSVPADAEFSFDIQGQNLVIFTREPGFSGFTESRIPLERRRPAERITRETRSRLPIGKSSGGKRPVTAGNALTVQMESPGISFQVMGTAMQSGEMGQEIRVRLVNGKIVRVQVDGENLVRFP